MATLRLFAQARDAAGATLIEVAGPTVGDVLDGAVAEFGPAFGAVVESSRIWLNGAAARRGDPVGDGDEVAVLPPVSGG